MGKGAKVVSLETLILHESHFNVSKIRSKPNLLLFFDISI